MKSARRMLSAVLCLSLLMTAFAPGAGAEFEVVEEAEALEHICSEEETHVHAFEEALPPVAPEVPDPPVAESDYPAGDATPGHYSIPYNKSGLKVQCYLQTGHFTNSALMCEVPKVFVTSGKNITGIKVVNEYYEEKQTMPSDRVISGTDDCTITWKDGDEQKSAEITLKEGLTGTIRFEITEEGSQSAVIVKISVNHMMGTRRGIEYEANCTHPKRTVMTQYCVTCLSGYYSYMNQEKDAKPLGHDFVKVEGSTVCGSEDAYVEKCSRCGEIKLSDGVDINSLEHSWPSESSVLQAATCTQSGISGKKCLNCDAVKDMTAIPALNHEFVSVSAPDGKYKVTVPATCSAQGTVTFTCKRDGCNGQTVAYYAKLAHKWELNGEYTKEPTCKDTGRGPAICSVCQTTEEDHEFPRIGHVFVNKSNAPTCEEPGNYIIGCKFCDYVSYKQDTVPAVGHKWGEDDGDCTTPIKCTVCGKDKAAAKTSHNFSKTWTTSDSEHWHVCTNPGCRVISDLSEHSKKVDGPCDERGICSVCGASAAATEHVWSEFQDVNEQGVPTEGGAYHARICQTCGQIDSLGKHFSTNLEFVLNDDGDCLTEFKCTCGKVLLEKADEHVFDHVSATTSTHHRMECSNRFCRQTSELEPHEFVEGWINVVPATCDADGHHDVEKYCAKCGYRTVTERNVVDPAGHKWGDIQYEDPDSPCVTETGSYQVCDVCGTKNIISVGVSQHDFPDPAVLGDAAYDIDVAPTCYTEGSRSIHCTRCSSTKDFETVPATGNHVYGEPYASVAATCDAPGESHYRCSTPGCTAEKTEVQDKLEHEWTEYVYLGDATCQREGHKSRQCNLCKKVEMEPDPEHPKTGHEFGTYYYNNDAKIEVDGTETAECIYGCGTTDTRTKAGTALEGHSFSVYKIVEAASCGKDAIEEAVCDVCGVATDRRPKEGTALSHRYDIIVTVKEADCVNEGTVRYTCSNCMEYYDDPVEPLGHSYGEYVYNNDATEVSDGTETATCSKCGDSISRTKPGTMLTVHSFTKWSIYTDASCTENAMEISYCDNGCGSVAEREAPGTALGHSYSPYTTDKSASCTENGTETATCSRCGATDTRVIDNSALGHDWSEWATVDMPDCDDSGTQSRHCKRCGVTETNGLAATGHKFTENNWTVDQHPTCTEDGSRSIKCDVCGITIQSEVMPKLGHSFGEYKDDGNATCEKDATETAKCERCDVTDTREKPGSKVDHDYDGEGVCRYCHTRRAAVKGDLNGDGIPDVSDGVRFQQILAGIEISPELRAFADLNGDGKIDVADGIEMQKIIAKLV